MNDDILSNNFNELIDKWYSILKRRKVLSINDLVNEGLSYPEAYNILANIVSKNINEVGYFISNEGIIYIYTDICKLYNYIKDHIKDMYKFNIVSQIIKSILITKCLGDNYGKETKLS